MAAVDEIAIKLGIKTGDLKAALSDANASIKTFKKEGESGGDGFRKSLEGAKKGLETFKSVLAGAGVVQLLKGLTDAALKFAEDYKGGFDADVAATLRLKESQQDLGSVIQSITGRIGVSLVGAMEKFGTAVGAMVYGTDAAADALNKMDEESRKAFDDAKLKKLREEEEKLTKARHAAALEAADDNEKVNILAGDYIKLLQEQQSLQKGSIEWTKKATEVFEKEVELRKAEAAVVKKEADDRKKAAEDAARAEKEYQDERRRNFEKLGELYEKERDMKLDDLTLSQRQNALIKEEKELVAELADLEEGTAEFNESYNRLLEVRGKLRKSETDAGKTNIEIAKLQLIPEEKRTDLQKEQLKLLMGETTEHEQQLELARLLNKGVENLTSDERARLLVLTGQTAEMKAQTAELEKQKGLTVSVTQKGDVTSLSDVQLDQVIQNLNKQISALKASYGALPPGYTPPELAILQNALFNAKKEQDLRRDFKQGANFFGNEWAERNYAPDVFDRLGQLLNPDQMKKDSQNLATLATGMQSMFPDKFHGALR